MRPRVDEQRIRLLARELGRVAREQTTLYLTGGSTAVLEGWRASTIDIDLRLEPESDALLRRLVELKDELAISVEPASPPDFIPELPGWRERSPFVFSAGLLTVRHFDPYSQALSKIERGFEHDISDVASMIASGLVDRAVAMGLFDTIEPQLFRYPAIDAPSFRRRVERVLGVADNPTPPKP